MTPFSLNPTFYLLQLFIEKADKLYLSIADCNTHDHNNVYDSLLQEDINKKVSPSETFQDRQVCRSICGRNIEE